MMMERLPCVAMLASLLLIAACDKSRQSDGNVVSPASKNGKEGLLYLNQSTIKGCDWEARSNLERAVNLTGIDFRMILLDSISSEMTVEDYAANLFDEWSIGKETNGKGVLFVLVEDRSALKIEISYELEDVFTDRFCGSFQEQIKLYFASRQFGDVVCNLINTMVRRYMKFKEEGKVDDASDLPESLDAEHVKNVESAFLSGGAGIIRNDYFYDKEAKLSKILLIDESVLAQYDAAKSPGETVERFLKSLEAGVNYPFLGVLLEGSRYMRLEYPKSPAFLMSLAEDYRRHGPYTVKVLGDLAVARYRHGAPVYPLLLRRDPEGFWRIDYTKGWAFAGASYDMQQWRMENTDNPWMFAFIDYSYEPCLYPSPRLIPFPLDIAGRIKALQERINNEPEEASNYFQLAEIFYWECYWIGSAIELVEKGLELQPRNIPYRWLAIQMRSRYPLLEENPRHLETILKYDPDNTQALYLLSWYCKTYMKDFERARKLRERYDDLR